MDPLPTPHPVKSKDSKPKIKQGARKGTVEPQIWCRQNRVFGTARNVNIPAKSVSDNKSTIKPKIGVRQKQPKSIPANQLPIDTVTKTEATDKKSSENVNFRLHMRSDILTPRGGQAEKSKDSAEPQTPAATLSSHVKTKSKVPATPFYTAVHCSKCRFDRLETSSYWVGQIKLAESVGKHFVAADFFRLALESQAEPIRNLRIELKRYLLRNGYLSEQKEWSEVAARYGLLKLVEMESSICSRNNGSDMG